MIVRHTNIINGNVQQIKAPLIWGKVQVHKLFEYVVSRIQTLNDIHTCSKKTLNILLTISCVRLHDVNYIRINQCNFYKKSSTLCVRWSEISEWKRNMKIGIPITTSEKRSMKISERIDKFWMMSFEVFNLPGLKCWGCPKSPNTTRVPRCLCFHCSSACYYQKNNISTFSFFLPGTIYWYH